MPSPLYMVPTAAALAAVTGVLVDPDKSWPVQGRLGVACFTLAALLLVMHGLAMFWQHQEMRVMGDASKTGHVAFAGAVMRAVLAASCVGSSAISRVGPYWDVVLIGATVYELIAHWELRRCTSPRFFKHLVIHHLLAILAAAILKLLECYANAAPIPETVVRLLWLYEGASGASDAWYVLGHTPLGVKLSNEWFQLNAPEAACFTVQRVLRIAACIRGVLLFVTPELAFFARIYGVLTYGFYASAVASGIAFEAYCVQTQLRVMRAKTGVPFA